MKSRLVIIECAGNIFAATIQSREINRQKENERRKELNKEKDTEIEEER